ncbi:hypothetical protein C5E07_11680 [Pseudoclavibacter sp. RFBJ3]|nr:hypothetical protein C5C12_10755 [Pseudoclavibacter sp. RFBJ5]PPF91747.1 hypothetical protein C5E07_11680 [Pseudoclavibacter sp. RFBJ3]PPF96684.1 hypothetical protein C5C19_14640 [Pseudoclavibacter sp. RFBH5]PPG19607.1 hypothetical protein C5E13_15980 [Pseudoclavibacter sp. RFBI4]
MAGGEGAAERGMKCGLDREMDRAGVPEPEPEPEPGVGAGVGLGVEPRAVGSLSVSEAVLGDDFARLDAQLQRYFGPIPAGHEGRGRGVYAWAGSRYRLLRPVLAWLAWRHVLFPERGRDVPFTVVNRPDGPGALSARREFEFPHVTRVMEDTMSVIRSPGARPRLVDRLGRRRGLEVELELSVEDGGLRMRSTRLALRLRMPHLPTRGVRGVRRVHGVRGVPGADAASPIRHLRIPLPRIVTMTLDERAHPDGDGRQCVDVRLRAPLLGDVFRYLGEFEYGIVPVLAPGAVRLPVSVSAPEPEPLPKPEQPSRSGDSGGFPGTSA